MQPYFLWALLYSATVVPAAGSAQQCRNPLLTVWSDDAMCALLDQLPLASDHQDAAAVAAAAAAEPVEPTEPAAPAERLVASQGEDVLLYDDGLSQYYRSKDAGKTCKERFSYASFDGGATVLKAGGSAKNARAILLENKDSYMLLECTADDKSVTVELSDDILIDTVVIANFEFFSSMVRHFRLSASDRYPARPDRWRDLGTFEARNSRDIQPFLVENPQIWARYVRLDFLSHYGSEYYCPLSLLRIHGTRMLESWNDGKDDDDPEPPPASEHQLGSGDRKLGQEDLPPGSASSDPTVALVGDSLAPTSVVDAPPLGFSLFDRTPFFRSDADYEPCPLSQPNGEASHQPRGDKAMSPAANLPSTRANNSSQPADSRLNITASTPEPRNDGHPIINPAPKTNNITNGAAAPVSSHPAAAISSRAAASASADAPSPSGRVVPAPAANATAAGLPKNKTAPTAASASPTVQESFFKSVSKRLQLLEANVTHLVRHADDDAQRLHGALAAHAARLDASLAVLDASLRADLRALNDSLQDERDQCQHSLGALGSCLAQVANEAVFQRRIAMVQALLLVAGLALVFFSRFPLPFFTADATPRAATVLSKSLGPQEVDQVILGPAKATQLSTSEDSVSSGQSSLSIAQISPPSSPSSSTC